MFAPIMYNFEGKRALVVGAGKVGLRRARKLKDYGCSVLILAPLFPKGVDFTGFDIRKETYDPKYLQNMDIVVAATDSALLNSQIISDAEMAKVPLTNAATKSGEANFIFPASFRTQDLVVSASTFGAYPALADRIVNEIQSKEEEYARKLPLLKRAREIVIDNSCHFVNKKAFLDELLDREPEFLEKFIRDPKWILGKEVVIGTRGSELALAQTREVIKAIAKNYPQNSFRVKIIKTQGDRDQNTPISKMAGQGVFVSDIEKKLIMGDIDIAVHSMKDIPKSVPEGLSVFEGVPPRAKSNDIIIFSKESTSKLFAPSGRGLNPVAGTVIGTGSARRRAQILERWPEVTVKGIRGNIDTRLKKLLNGEYDALVISQAAIDRLGYDNERLESEGLIFKRLNFITTPNQGMIGLEYRSGDENIRTILESITDPKTTLQYKLESYFENLVGGGCIRPIGGHANIAGNLVQFQAYISDGEGHSASGSTAFRNEERMMSEIQDLVFKLERELVDQRRAR